MASRRTSTWPPTNQSGRKWIQGPSFAPVRTREEEDTPHHSEAEDIQSHSEVEDGQGHKGTPSHSEVEDTQSPLKVENTGKETSPTEIRKLFHSLGFETVYLLFKEIRGHPVTEEKKVAIIYDLRSACYVSLLHIIPTAASVTLLVFNWKGYYIGDELQGPVGQDGLRFLGLQFAAKMLEFLAVASLSAILFSLLRAQLIYDSLPFGAVTAGFEFNNLSLLWSKELLPPALLVTTIVVFTVLGATIGPSAAVASQPVLRNWPGGGTVFWLNATSQELWPSHLDGVAAPDLPCTSSQNTSCFPPNYSLLASEMLSFWPSNSFLSADGGTIARLMLEKASISGRHSIHTLEARFIGPFVYHPYLTSATTPSAAIADALSQVARYWDNANSHQCSVGKTCFHYYNDILYTVNAMQPLTYVRCSASDINGTVQFPRLDQGIEKYPLVNYSSSTIGSQQWFDVATGNGSYPGLSWVELPEATFGRASVGAITALPGTKTNTGENDGQIFACTIDARWANATSTISFLGGPMIVSGLPTQWLGGAQYLLDSKGLPLWPQVTIAPEWAESISSIVTEPSLSVFAALCNSIACLGNVLDAISPINAVEAVLAVMITDSLARTTSAATILGSLKDRDNGKWITEFLPKDTVFGTGGSAFNYSFRAGDQWTQFEARTAVNGYGYGTTAATLLSTLVLFIYSFIAMIYVIHSTCLAKTTSSSWESITELVALAANSAPSSVLKNTGAGIATLGTLKQPVRIGVSDDRLQMVFEDREAVDKIIRNKLYS
ncbi:hypothetical protein N431DRAFT_488715 [Stipitochalara longipes BDJ]|nr:hypothetical protein N431DRAFT_488715 [Stipitochalara longipes BDJ]